MYHGSNVPIGRIGSLVLWDAFDASLFDFKLAS